MSGRSDLNEPDHAPNDIEQQECQRRRVRWINLGWSVFLLFPFFMYWLLWFPGWFTSCFEWFKQSLKYLLGL